MPPKATASAPAMMEKVSYSAGRKINDPAERYATFDFHASYSTDVCPGETPMDAYLRAAEVVEAMLEKKVRQAQRGKLQY